MSVCWNELSPMGGTWPLFLRHREQERNDTPSGVFMHQRVDLRLGIRQHWQHEALPPFAYDNLYRLSHAKAVLQSAVHPQRVDGVQVPASCGRLCSICSRALRENDTHHN